MSNPVGSVNDGGNPYAGGSLTRAGRPTGVSGDFASMGSGGFPTPSAGQIAVARNNQGTNVRIPYSRVVPMHGKDKLRVRDSRLLGTGFTDVYEYDGLEAGELAWVMGKQFAVTPRQGANFPSLAATAVSQATLLSNVTGPTGIHKDASRRKALEAIIDSWRSVPPGGFVQAAGGGVAPGGPHHDPRTGRPIHPNAAFPEGTTPVGPDGAALVPQQAFGGYGPDRMQRMAYTNWVEAFFEQRIATQTIDLHSLHIMDDARTHAFLDSDIAFYGNLLPVPTRRGDNVVPRYPEDHPGPLPYLHAATALSVPDLAYALQATPGMKRPYGQVAGQDINLDLRGPNEMQVQVAMKQGLFVMEKGPFLRTYGSEDSTVTVRLPDGASGRQWVRSSALETRPRSGRSMAAIDETPKLADVPRHLGSQLAQKALLCALKKHGVFNWVPDGICLSKFATGPDGYADDHFDARQGQLFNVGVQGPCITKTWAMGDSNMHAMPGDKVFMLVVGTVNYEIGSHGDVRPESLKRAANRVIDVNGRVTRELSREGFERNISVHVSGETGPVDRPNGANYRVRDPEDDTAEEARRILANEGGKMLQETRDGLEAAAADDQDSYYGSIFRELSNAMNDLRATAEPTRDGVREWEAMKARAEAALEQAQAPTSDYARGQVSLDSFRQIAESVRNGTESVAKAQLSDLRLMRATSSFLTNTSHFDHKDPKSRCGLRIGFLEDPSRGYPGLRNPRRPPRDGTGDPGSGETDEPGSGETDEPGSGENGDTGSGSGDRYSYYKTPQEVEVGITRGHIHARLGMRRDNTVRDMPMPDIAVPPTFGVPGSLRRPPQSGVADYIVGGWCIGTVMDSAASRAMMHAQQVRTAPSSMAINVNVNVEWWDSDKLHAHYMDVDRGHYAGGTHPSVEVVQRKGGAPPVGIQDKLRSVPMGTVMQRNQPTTRSIESYVDELSRGVRQTVTGSNARGLTNIEYSSLKPSTTRVGEGGDDISLKKVVGVFDEYDAVAARDLAVRRLTQGKGEYEGGYVQPDPRGVDRDPQGKVIYDNREITAADRRPDGYLAQSPDSGEVMEDTRLWKFASQ